MRFFFLSVLLVYSVVGNAQDHPVYKDLPVGKHKVGFKIISIIDESRVTKPEFNYLGEKNEGDRTKKITIHLWYPAIANSGKRTISFEEYCYNNLLTATNENISGHEKNRQVNQRRAAIERWFGKTSDSAWSKLLTTPMLARADALRINHKSPVLIGMLRPLSTSITNELLASNGYVVAMVKHDGPGTFSEAALQNIPDMQFALSYLEKNESIDANYVGAFGFSGSGFAQVLFTMYDYRIKALADLESGLYMDGLFQGLSASNYYNPGKLRAPFLHIFSNDLSRQEKYIDEFEKKTKFAKRYRLLLNQPALHHWDFATEGYSSCIYLNNRGGEKDNIMRSFEIASTYLLNFFDAELKGDPKAKKFLSAKPAIAKIQPALWDITHLSAGKPAPDREEFEYIVRTKGIRHAVELVNNTIKNDSSSNIMQWFSLNGLGYIFLNEKKYEEAIGVFRLNTDLHPDDPNLFDSLAEGYELSGDKESMVKVSEMVMEILNKKTNLSDADKGLKENARKRLKEQGK